MKILEIVESAEQRITNTANSMVAKAKAGDIGGAADDMEAMHNQIARLDIGSGLYDFMQKTLKQLKALVASNPNHPEAPKFQQAIKDIEAELPNLKQAAADSRRMAVDAGAGRQDVGEGKGDEANAKFDPLVADAIAISKGNKDKLVAAIRYLIKSQDGFMEYWANTDPYRGGYSEVKFEALKMLGLMEQENIAEQELDVMSADDKEVVLKDPQSGIETKIPRDPTKPGMIQKDPSDATGKRFVIDTGAAGEVDKGIQPGAKVVMKQPM